MARYRTYKNGITGHRYKGYYIIKGDEKGKFSVCRDDKTVVTDSLYDYEECEWFIDKETSSEENMIMLKELYSKELYQLSSLLVDLMQRNDRQGGLNQKDESLYRWCEKIRRRKADDRQF